MASTTTPRFSVKPGVCEATEESGDAPEECRISSDQCRSGTSWLSGMEITQIVGWSRFRDCVSQSTLQDMPVGQCAISSGSGEDTVCAPNPESCAPSSKTSSSAVSFSDWTMTSTNGCILKDARFGSCNGDDGTVCRYSPEQCPKNIGVDWTFPHEACTCDMVQVGACHNSKKDIAVCAVNEQACSAATTFIPVENVLSTLGYECFLCREQPVPQEEVPTLDAPSSSTSKVQSSGTSSGSKKTNAVIVGSAIGGLVVAMLFVAMALIVRRQRQNRDQSTSWTKTLDQPPQDVAFGNTTASDSRHQGDSTLDDDDISVL